MNGNQYALKNGAYNALAVVKKGNATAAQWADADVLLSAMYAAMGQDLLSGQIDPKSVNQAWHINPQNDDVDSALPLPKGDRWSRSCRI